MTKIQDLLNLGELEVALQDGYVRERKHPDDPSMVILNYTEKAQFENVWTNVTRQCRGLIVDFPTGKILARPYPKFLNYGQPGAAEITGLAEVTDKVDGSLGILYPAPEGGWAIATRGSFESEQAIHATALLRERYAAYLKTVGYAPKGEQRTAGVTRLFEIIYPGNRIVLDYGTQDDLVMLGGVGITSGRIFGPNADEHWTGPRSQVFLARDLATAVSLPPRANAEGLVVRDVETGGMVKIKQEDYVRLHKIVTGLSERGVWEHLSTHEGKIDDLVMQVPDEFHTWLRDVSNGLLEQFEEQHGLASAAYEAAMYEVAGRHGDEYDEEFFPHQRRWFANYIREEHADVAPLAFLLLDGRDLSPAIWKRIRPVGHRPMTHRTEEIA